jgi:hypothetical protein
MKRTERVRHRKGMYSGSVQGGSDSDGRSRLSPLDLCARSPSSALRSIPESMSRFAGWHERVANRVFFFYIYSVVGVVSRPLPIVVVVLAPSRSVLRSQVTARRPVLFRFYGGSGLRLRRPRGDQVLQLRPPWPNSFLGGAGVGFQEHVCNSSLES